MKDELVIEFASPTAFVAALESPGLYVDEEQMQHLPIYKLALAVFRNILRYIENLSFFQNPEKLKEIYDENLGLDILLCNDKLYQ